jgi:radical SAM superfamily enzyme YgiQ (UPF0313 family)
MTATSAPRRIALLWPRGFDPSTTISLALGYLRAGLDPELYEVRVFDCALDDLGADSAKLRRSLEAFAPEVLGVSTWSPMYPEAVALVQLAKAIDPETVTVMGGAHPSSYAERCMEVAELDFVFSGEAELSFPVLLQELSESKPNFERVLGLVWRAPDGSLRKNAPERAEDLDQIQLPDYQAIRLDEYQRQGYRWNSPPVSNAPLWVTRGCPYRCQYCAAPDLNGRPVRTHSIGYMRRWIQGLYDQGVRWFNIIDDNFTYHVPYAKDFCRMVIDLQLGGAGFGTPNGIRMLRGDPELWALMKKAGWHHLIIAPESGAAHTLELMKKDLDVGEVPRVVAEIQAAGLKCQAFFIIGYPGETEAAIEETFRLIRKCRFNFVFLANFQPLPGTPIYDDLVAAGEIEDGLLPFAFSDGIRVYTPPELADFNFSRFILKTHLMMAASNPRNLPYHTSILFHLYKPSFVAKKLLRTTWTMLRPQAQRPVAPFVPMHQQAQRARLD